VVQVAWHHTTRLRGSLKKGLSTNHSGDPPALDSPPQASLSSTPFFYLRFKVTQETSTWSVILRHLSLLPLENRLAFQNRLHQLFEVLYGRLTRAVWMCSDGWTSLVTGTRSTNDNVIPSYPIPMGDLLVPSVPKSCLLPFGCGATTRSRCVLYSANFLIIQTHTS
jgi:hypothetical protein